MVPSVGHSRRVQFAVNLCDQRLAEPEKPHKPAVRLSDVLNRSAIKSARDQIHYAIHQLHNDDHFTGHFL
jgi:hypothetical protein